MEVEEEKTAWGLRESTRVVRPSVRRAAAAAAAAAAAPRARTTAASGDDDDNGTVARRGLFATRNQRTDGRMEGAMRRKSQSQRTNKREGGGQFVKEWKEEQLYGATGRLSLPLANER